MSIDGVASGSGVLSCNAAGLAAPLEESCLVNDQHAARVGPEVREYIVAQIVAHPVGIPARDAQQALHTLRIGIADRLGELPAILALDAVE